jgi:hypothetical protein
MTKKKTGIGTENISGRGFDVKFDT